MTYNPTEYDEAKFEPLKGAIFSAYGQSGSNKPMEFAKALTDKGLFKVSDLNRIQAQMIEEAKKIEAAELDSDAKKYMADKVVQGMFGQLKGMAENEAVAASRKLYGEVFKENPQISFDMFEKDGQSLAQRLMTVPEPVIPNVSLDNYL